MEERDTYQQQAIGMKEMLRSNMEELERFRKAMVEGSVAATAQASNLEKQAQLQQRLDALRGEVRDAEKRLADSEAALAAAVAANEAARAAHAAAVADASATHAAAVQVAAAAAEAVALTSASEPPSLDTAAAPTGDDATAAPASTSALAADDPLAVASDPLTGGAAATAEAEAPAVVAAAASSTATPVPPLALVPAPTLTPTVDLEAAVTELRKILAGLKSSLSAAEDEAEDSASAAVKQTRLRERTEREAKEKVAAMEAALEAKIREVAALQEAASNVEAGHARNLEVGAGCGGRGGCPWVWVTMCGPFSNLTGCLAIRVIIPRRP